MKRLLLRSNIPLIFILQLFQMIYLTTEKTTNVNTNLKNRNTWNSNYAIIHKFPHKFERLVPLATLVDETPFHFQFPFRPTRSNPGIIHGRRYFPIPRLILIKERNGRVHFLSRYENRYYSSGSPLPMALCTCGFMVLQRRDWLVCGQAPLYNDGSMVNNPT